jgi:hypothetical protein
MFMSLVNSAVFTGKFSVLRALAQVFSKRLLALGAFATTTNYFSAAQIPPWCFCTSLVHSKQPSHRVIIFVPETGGNK